MKKVALFILLYCSMNICFADDPARWDYFSSVTGFEGKWKTLNGEAVVEISGDKINISIFTHLEIPGSTNVSQPIEKSPSEVLKGTITKDGKIDVIDTVLDSDVDDVKISGNLYQRVEVQHWGDKEVHVQYETIILANKFMIIGLTRRARVP